MAKHEPGPYFVKGSLIQSKRLNSLAMMSQVPHMDPEWRQATAELLAAAPRLLDAACIAWDALSVLLESIESTLTKEDRAGAHEAMDRLFKINEDLNGLIIKQEDTVCSS